MTQSTYNDTAATGLDYIANSFHTFGNNGTYGQGAPTNANITALNDLQGPLTKSAVESALTTASDHLPVVADYTIAAVPEPASLGLLVFGSLLAIHRRRR